MGKREGENGEWGISLHTLFPKPRAPLPPHVTSCHLLHIHSANSAENHKITHAESDRAGCAHAHESSSKLERRVQAAGLSTHHQTGACTSSRSSPHQSPLLPAPPGPGMHCTANLGSPAGECTWEGCSWCQRKGRKFVQPATRLERRARSTTHSCAPIPTQAQQGEQGEVCACPQ